MKFHFTALFTAVALASTPAVQAQTVVKLRLAHELPITHYGHVYTQQRQGMVVDGGGR